MSGRNNRHAAEFLPSETLPEPEAVLGVEAGGGFVQEHGFRVAHKSEGNVDAPSLATRKLLSLLGFQFRPRFPENY